MKLVLIITLLILSASCKCNNYMYTCPSPKYEPAPAYKTVIKIESCANSGRCRVIFNDGTTDLLLLPDIGMKIKTKI